MQVHLVSIKIGVIWIADALVQTECSPRSDFDVVTHDAEFVKRWLSIEKNNVAVLEMPLYDITNS
jgi:hypothetical protein